MRVGERPAWVRCREEDRMSCLRHRQCKVAAMDAAGSLRWPQEELTWSLHRHPCKAGVEGRAHVADLEIHFPATEWESCLHLPHCRERAQEKELVCEVEADRYLQAGPTSSLRHLLSLGGAAVRGLEVAERGIGLVRLPVEGARWCLRLRLSPDQARVVAAAAWARWAVEEEAL